MASGSSGYGWSLRWVLEHRRVMLVVFVAVIGATVWMYGLESAQGRGSRFWIELPMVEAGEDKSPNSD